MLTVAIFILSYLIGAIPVGRLVARSRGVNIEKIGSGNVGATNVARSLGKKAGLITLIGDIAKGAVATWIGYRIFQHPTEGALTGMLAVFGHCLGIPTLSKGGKGVATSIGVITMISPLIGAIALGVFTAFFLVFRIVSVASISAALSLPIVTLALPGAEPFRWPLSTIALLVIIRHRQNIRRILQGEEPSFHFKEKSSS